MPPVIYISKVVKVSRPNQSRDQNVGLGLGLDLGLEDSVSVSVSVLNVWSRLTSLNGSKSILQDQDQNREQVASRRLETKIKTRGRH